MGLKQRDSLGWRMFASMAAGLAMLIFGSAEQNAKAAPAAGRPNILLCIADDMSWAHAGIAGDPAIKTPHFDRLAKAGVRFEHAFCSSPSCTPSRGALLSGQAFCRLEEGASLLSTLPAKFPLYPDLLEKAGYVVGCTGKGWGPGDWRAGGRTRNPAGPNFNSLDSFLETVPANKPFCFWFGSHDPHRPYEAGTGARAGIDPAKVAVPPIVPDSPEMRADIADYLFEVQRFDQDVGAVLGALERKNLLTNTLVVVTSDNGMPYPRGKCSLYDWGTRMPMVIAWPGKITANRVVTDFISLVDLAPTFLEVAGAEIPGEMTGRSLLPILLSQKSGQVERERDRAYFGRERHDSFRMEGGRPVGYPMRAVRTADYLYIRNFQTNRFPSGDAVEKNQDNDSGPAKTFVVSHKDDPAVAPFYSRAYGRRPAEELYDLAKDPGQTNNVASEKAYAQARERLRLSLDQWMTEMKDPRRPGSKNPDVFDDYPVYQSPGRGKGKKLEQ